MYFMLCVISLIWLAWAALSWWVTHAPVRQADPYSGAIYRLVQLYVRLVHRLQIKGAEHIPTDRPPLLPSGRPDPDAVHADRRPLIIVANHISGVDPLLIQAALRFEPRWMMALDMRAPSLEWLWELTRIIFVDRNRRDSSSLREAMRHLRAGGVLGIFPEAFLERPAQELLPFKEGVGLLVKRTDALVLPAIVSGVPVADPAWASLWRFSRARVRFLPVIDYRASDLTPQQIADDLRHRFAHATGWPFNDRAPRANGDGTWTWTDANGLPATGATPP